MATMRTGARARRAALRANSRSNPRFNSPTGRAGLRAAGPGLRAASAQAAERTPSVASAAVGRWLVAVLIHTMLGAVIGTLVGVAAGGVYGVVNDGFFGSLAGIFSGGLLGIQVGAGLGGLVGAARGVVRSRTREG